MSNLRFTVRCSCRIVKIPVADLGGQERHVTQAVRVKKFSFSCSFEEKLFEH